MRKRSIGIVLTKVEKDTHILGYDTEIETFVALAEDGWLKIGTEVLQTEFCFNTKTGILEVEDGASFWEAESVGRKLKKIGYENVVLLFKGKEYKIRT